jgi:ABC-type transport system substrate-binding protein
MRSLTSRSRSGLVAAAAAVLLTACSGGGPAAEEAAESTSADTSTTSASSSPTEPTSSSAAPSTSADPAVAQFCAQAASFNELGSQLTSATPEQLPPLLQQAAGAFDSVQPPAEIASAWQAVGDAVQAFADTANSVDVTTPEGQTQLQGAAQQFVSVANGPDGTAVQQFGATNCGTGGTPAPTT